MFQKQVLSATLIVYLTTVPLYTTTVASLECYDCVGYVGEACDTSPESISQIQHCSHQRSFRSNVNDDRLDSFMNVINLNDSFGKSNSSGRSGSICITVVGRIPDQQSMIGRLCVPAEQTCTYIMQKLEEKGYIAELCDECNTNLCNSKSPTFF